MNLYYEVGDQQVGPIGKTELQTLVKTKKLNAGTLVWQEGMESWQKLGVFVRNRTAKAGQKNAPAGSIPTAVCSECGLAYAEEEMIRFQDSWVCAVCKPVFVQKVKEGVPVAGAMEYAGFWIRFAAFTIDAFIMLIVNLVIFIPLGILMPAFPTTPWLSSLLCPCSCFCSMPCRQPMIRGLSGNMAQRPGKWPAS